MTNFLNHPVINDSLPPRDKMLVYFHSRRKALSDAKGTLFIYFFFKVYTPLIILCYNRLNRLLHLFFIKFQNPFI